MCGNSLALGKCKHGCNLDFTGCQNSYTTTDPSRTVVSETTYLPVAASLHTALLKFRELPRLEPIDR